MYILLYTLLELYQLIAIVKHCPPTINMFILCHQDKIMIIIYPACNLLLLINNTALQVGQAHMMKSWYTLELKIILYNKKF